MSNTLGNTAVTARAVVVAVTLVIAFVLTCGSPATAPSPPNIILIVTDDHGWTSVSYRADPDIPESASDYIETPRLERMALEGMRFTDGYAPNPICSPTRHSLLFGQNAARHTFAKSLDWIENDPKRLTLPKAIKLGDERYRTAHFGKWHVGVMPAEMGFDYTDGLSSNAQGDLSNGEHRNTDEVGKLLEQYNAKHDVQLPGLNGRWSKQPLFYADEDPKAAVSMTNRVEAFMREAVADGVPFFAYVAHYASHLDLVSNSESYEYFKNKPPGKRHDNPGYAAMTKDLDTQIGRVMDLVGELGIADHTYIAVIGDNGGVQYFDQSATLAPDNSIVEAHETSIAWRNLPLRDGKHEYYEGGIRVPFLMMGPGIEPGSVCRKPVTGLDFVPTFAEWAGHEGSLPGVVDGDSLASLVVTGCNGKLQRNRDALFFHQAAQRVPLSAVRKGNYKLVKHWLKPDKGGKYGREKQLELFDLSNDLGETTDVSEKYPEIAEGLHKELLAFLEEAKAETAHTDRDDPYGLLLRQRRNAQFRNKPQPRQYRSPFH